MLVGKGNYHGTPLSDWQYRTGSKRWGIFIKGCDECKCNLL